MAVCEAGRSLVAPPRIAHKSVVSGRKPPDRDSVSASPDLPFADTFPTQFAAPTVRAGARGSSDTEVATCSTSLSARIPSPDRYAGKRIFALRREDYVYLVPFVEHVPYSLLSAIAGSTRVARTAGIPQATMATTTRVATARSDEMSNVPTP